MAFVGCGIINDIIIRQRYANKKLTCSKEKIYVATSFWWEWKFHIFCYDLDYVNT